MESVSGKKPMVKYWMHTGFLNVKGEKMSKSLGNFITIKELSEKYPLEVFRFFVLSTHYRSPIDFSAKILEQANNSLNRIYKLIEIINENLDGNISQSLDNDIYYTEKVEDAQQSFIDAMDNDFNTPLAISLLFDLIRDVHRDINQQSISKNSLKRIKTFIIQFGILLGFDFSLTQKISPQLDDELIKILTDLRDILREKKEYDLSDEIRNRLKTLNIVIEDK